MNSRWAGLSYKQKFIGPLMTGKKFLWLPNAADEVCKLS